MKIDKVKYDFFQQQRQFLGTKFVDDIKHGMRWVYKTQTKYNISFECLGFEQKEWLIAACKLFHSVPEGVKKNIGSIQMTPDPQVFWRIEPNLTAKMLVDLGWERVQKALGESFQELRDKAKDNGWDDDDDTEEEEDKKVVDISKVTHDSMDNFIKDDKAEDDSDDEEEIPRKRLRKAKRVFPGLNVVPIAGQLSAQAKANLISLYSFKGKKQK